MEKIKCVYAIVDSSGTTTCSQNHRSKNIPGLKGTSTIAIPYRNIAAIVSNIHKDQTMISKEMAIDYAGVIEELVLHYTVLPIRFGTFLESSEAVEQMLKRYYDKFSLCLKDVSHKYEFCLKVFWDHDTCLNRIRYEEDTLNKEVQKIITGSSNHSQYLLSKLKEHKVEEKILNYVDLLVDEIHSHLKPLHPVVKMRKMVSKSLILDAVYLLDKHKKEEFLTVIAQFNNQHEHLNLLVTGPWAPYSFADIKI